MVSIDEKDGVILNILQKDCRASLTYIANQIGLSVDSIKKRLAKLEKQELFHSKIQIRPRKFGYDHIVDVKIKLNNYGKKDYDSLINYFIDCPRIPEIFSISGQWDLSIVIIAKNANDYNTIFIDIKSRFGSIIYSWNESMTLNAYKFESYDILKLIKEDKK